MVNETIEQPAHQDSGLDGAVERLFTGIVTFNRRARATGRAVGGPGSELTRSQLMLLLMLVERGDQRPGAIADALEVGPAVVTRHVAALSGRGLVDRRKDPGDGRADLVSITESGRTVMRERHRMFLAAMRESYGYWGAERLNDAAQTLEDLAKDLPAERQHRDQQTEEKTA